MAFWLKQSTAVTIQMGPFLDATDGVTVESGLTITAANTKLQKAFAAQAAKNDATAASYDADGYYRVVLNATDTGTLGALRVIVDDSTTHLPVWEDFIVMPANVYDSLIAGSDNLAVDTTLWAGAATASSDVALATAPTNFADLAITASTGRTTANVTHYGGVAGTFSGGLPEVNLAQWLGTAPLALSSQRVQTLVGAMASAVVTAAAVATDAIDADALAADATTQITDDIMAEIVETQGSYTVQQVLSIVLAVLAGESSSGGATIATPDGVATRVAATVDGSNNRTAMTLTPSS